MTFRDDSELDPPNHNKVNILPPNYINPELLSSPKYWIIPMYLSVLRRHIACEHECELHLSRDILQEYC